MGVKHMAETFVAILTAHLIGDFIFQTEGMIKRKREWSIFLLHIVIVTITTYLLIGSFHWPILAAILLTHFIIDVAKVYWMKDSCLSFVIDQGSHLLVLIGLALLFTGVPDSGWWATAFGNEHIEWYYASLSILSGLILTLKVGGILIGKFTAPFREEIEEGMEGLENGGLYIGYLERILVMILLMTDITMGIGFLFASKSILRIGEIKDTGQRKVAEYIIIGTFFSFVWAISISVLTLKAINNWLPEAL